MLQEPMAKTSWGPQDLVGLKALFPIYPLQEAGVQIPKPKIQTTNLGVPELLGLLVSLSALLEKWGDEHALKLLVAG